MIRVEGLGCGVQILGFMVWDFGFGVRGFWVGVWFLSFWASGLVLRV
jgi:hypothetical protein